MDWTILHLDYNYFERVYFGFVCFLNGVLLGGRKMCILSLGICLMSLVGVFVNAPFQS